MSVTDEGTDCRTEKRKRAMGITYLCVVLGGLAWSQELGQDGIMVLFAKNSGCFVQSDL